MIDVIDLTEIGGATYQDAAVAALAGMAQQVAAERGPVELFARVALAHAAATRDAHHGDRTDRRGPEVLSALDSLGVAPWR